MEDDKCEFEYDPTFFTLIPTVCVDLKKVELWAAWLFWTFHYAPKGLYT